MGDEKFKFSIETAKENLEKMFEYYEINIDEIEDEELRKHIKAGYDRLVKAVRLGRLEIDVSGKGIQIMQTLRSGGDPIIYREIDGAAKCEMDGFPAQAYNKKAQALMGALSGLGMGAIKNLKSVDLSLAEVLGLIFLAV